MPDEVRKLDPSEFPKIFSEIPQPPKELYLRGTLPDPSSIFLTVVGSRNHTNYGKDVCEKLIEGLAGFPVVIVSGLALGIDTIAHKTALKIGLKTLAIPGSGIDSATIYPRANENLAKEIVANGGCILSEFPNGFGATAWSFPQRNRLMAGISEATLVIEAEEKSGTLITSKLATDYNRDVFTIPGSIFSPASKGTNQLLKLGATPICSVEELIEALGFNVEKKDSYQQELFDCSPDEKIFLELLREPMSRDDLIRKSGLGTAKANAILSIMEIKGLIKESVGEMRRN